MAKIGDKRTNSDGSVQQLKTVGHGNQWVTISGPTKTSSSGGKSSGSSEKSSGGGGGGGGKTDTNQVHQIYRNLLGRSADSSGLKTYAGMSASDIEKSIKNSEEYKKRQSSTASGSSNRGSTSDATSNEKPPLNERRRETKDGRVEERVPAGHGYRWVTIYDPRATPNAYGVTYSGRDKKEAERVAQETGQTVTVETSIQGMTRVNVYVVADSHRQTDPIGHAFRSVAKRAPSERERAHYAQFVSEGEKGRLEINEAELQKHIAANLNVKDKDRWGVTSVDPSTLSDKDREYYDIWRRYNPNTEFTTATQDFIRWSRGGGNTTAFEAGLRGLIRTNEYRTEDGELRTYTFISPQATEFARNQGQEIYINGNQRGREYYGDLGGIQMSNIQVDLSEPDEYGFYGGAGKGNPRKGLIGGDVGKFFTKEVSGQLKFIMDPLGVVTPTLFGTKYGEDLQKGGSQLTGADIEDIQKGQQIGQNIAASALAFVPGIGLALSAGMRALSASSNARTYRSSQSEGMRDAAKAFIVDAVSVGVAKGFSNANAATSAYQTAYTSAHQSAINAGATAAQANAVAVQSGNAAISGLTKLTQGAIQGTISGAVSGAMADEGLTEKNILAGAAVGAGGSIVSNLTSSTFNSAASWLESTAAGSAIGFTAQNDIYRALVSGSSNFASTYAQKALQYGIDENFRKQVNDQIALGAIDNKDDLFLRESAVSGTLGAYSGFRQASTEFGDTLGDLIEKPTDGYFSDFGFSAENPSPIKEQIPTLGQVFFGEDNDFQWKDVFGGQSAGGYQGVAEAFIEASALVLFGSFAAGAINPRVGSINPELQPYDPEKYESGLGFGYGGWGGLGGIADGSGPSPSGSEAIEQIAERL